MAVRISTNYLFNGVGFLDSRQGMATTLNDLRNWNFSEVAIPDGFEVCVDGVWYIYNSDYLEDSETGKFRKRAPGGSGSDFNSDPTAKIVKEGLVVGEAFVYTTPPPTLNNNY